MLIAQPPRRAFRLTFTALVHLQGEAGPSGGAAAGCRPRTHGGGGRAAGGGGGKPATP